VARARSPEAERHDPPLEVRRFVAAADLGREALLAEAARRLEGTPASAERAFWHGGVHVNGRPLDPDAPAEAVAAGSQVVVYAFVREPEPVPCGPLAILHDGDGVVAVDKPAWLPMQRTRASARFSLEAVLRAQLGDAALVAAHRLDRQTSGVALFARGRGGAWASREFGARRVAKRYLAVTARAPERDAFEVEGWLGRARDPARFRFALYEESESAPPGAAASRTSFRVLARGASGALVEAVPETGRTHQIRVHLASVGAPVAGDELYGEGASAFAPRVLLHAGALELPRPCGGALRLEAALPPDLAHAAALLGAGVAPASCIR
jgi:23S rRNA pseudouridine1911/1915/1917 synthase